MVVRLVIAPGAREAVAIIVRVQTSGFRTILKSPVSLVVAQKIGRPVASIEVGNRIVILIQSQIVAIQTKIDVEQSVSVIVGDGCVSEGSLWRMPELESIWLQLKFSLSVIQKE